MANPHTISRIAIVGFGEVGGIFGADFAAQGIKVSVFDILLASEPHRQPMLAKASSCGVNAEDSLRDCLRDADLVISAVTASSALAVAQKAGSILQQEQLFLDLNSVSPETKRKACACIEGDSGKRGGRFVEAAVMAAVPGKRLKVPMLLGGMHAKSASDLLLSLGMDATAWSDQIGVASAVKMCRSVLIKGLEALTVECLFAARRYGAEDAVLESLAATYPGMGWKDRLPDYLISRVAKHGQRRAASYARSHELFRRSLSSQTWRSPPPIVRSNWHLNWREATSLFGAPINSPGGCSPTYLRWENEIVRQSEPR